MRQPSPPYPARRPPGPRIAQRWTLTNGDGCHYTFTPTERGVGVEFTGGKDTGTCRCTVPLTEARALWVRLRRKGYSRY